MWSFSTPEYLFLILLVPFGIYFSHIDRNRKRTFQFPVSIWKGPRVPGLFRGIKAVRFTLAVLFWTGILLCVIALGGPEQIEKKKVFLSRGIDIMIVLDESPSMSAKDFIPKNRFEAAKGVIRDFIRKRDHDPIGLVSFGKEAALRVPPTLDYRMVRERLDSLSIMDLGDGTAIGMGLSVALLHLKESTAEEKVIILLTDGENNAGEVPPDTAAEIARTYDIRVYAIGVGTKGEAPIEFTDPKTGKQYRGTFQGGFDEGLLRGIADRTGGHYFSAANAGSLNVIFDAIDAIETERSVTKIRVTRLPKHRPFVVWGLCLILLSFFCRRLILQEVVP